MQDPEAATPEKFHAVLPETHRRFLEESLRLHHQEGDYLFVHAGVRPGIPLADQHRDFEVPPSDSEHAVQCEAALKELLDSALGYSGQS